MSKYDDARITRLPLVKKLCEIGLPKSWIASALDINQLTLEKDIAVHNLPYKKNESGKDTYRLALKYYANLSAETSNSFPALLKTLDKWLALDDLRSNFQILDQAAARLYHPENLGPHKGYFNLLCTAFNHSPTGTADIWRHQIAGYSILNEDKLPGSIHELTNDFMDKWSEDCKNGRIGLAWTVKEWKDHPRSIIESIINNLEEREEIIIRHRFGLDAELLTLNMTAKIVGLSEERIRQIEYKILAKLRKSEQSQMLRGFLSADLSLSAKIMENRKSDFIQHLINFADNTGLLGRYKHEQSDEQKKKESFGKMLYCKCEDIELSVRSSRCLEEAGIRYLWQLVQMTDSKLYKLKNFGRKSLGEIKAMLADYDLSLGMDVGDWPDPRSLE